MKFLNTVKDLNGNEFRQKLMQYQTTTAASEGYYRVATIPMTAQYKNSIFKIKAFTATGTVTECTVILDIGYYSGNYGSQYIGIVANTSHSYNSDTTSENGWVLRYIRVSFDGSNGYIDVYKCKSTIVTIEIEPLVESDWIWASGVLNLNPAVGAYRNQSAYLSFGMRGNNIWAQGADSAAYSSYGTHGTNTLSNANDKTGQWAYFGNFYIAYNSSYLRGHSCNVRVRVQEVSFDGSVSPELLDDFILSIRVNLGYHANSTEFNSLVPTFDIELSDGKTTLNPDTDICALVYSTSTSTKYVRLYIKLKSANTVYVINPEQRYGRSFGTSSFSQTASYCYFNYAGDQTPGTLPTPAQGNVVYAVKQTIDADTLGGKAPSEFASKVHTHAKSEITDMPTSLSQFTNDVGFTQNALQQTVGPTQPATHITGQVWIQTS